MSLWPTLGIIFVAGFLGGLVNALITDNGFVLPKYAEGIWRPGFLSTAFIGAVAAVVSWGLYGPFPEYYLLGSSPVGAPSALPIGLTVGSSVTAVLVGIGGARWLTDQVDKRLLKAAASVAARKVANHPRAAQIATAMPAKALEFANAMADP
ncbi:MAG: hypothetical protein JO320_12680 [Alphaproteobacteria bacterium]|nr:hypothetical protein [Alphaproteobacteria bacterium]